MVRDNVDEIVTVSEEEIKIAMRAAYERMKLVVEPSGVVGIAALMSPRLKDVCLPDADKPLRVGIVLSGGNLDVMKLTSFFSVKE